MSGAARPSFWPGVCLALASAFLFGALTPVSKRLLAGFDPQLLAGALYLGAGVGLALVGVLRAALGRPAREAPLRRADLPWLAAVILFGGLAAPLLLMLGLARTEAAAAALLLNLEAAATLAIAWIIFHENVDRRLLLGALAILAGAALLSWSGPVSGAGATPASGVLLIAAACLAWGLDNNLTRKLSSADPAQIAMAKGLTAGAVNVGLALWRGVATPPAGLVAAAALVGFFAIGLSLVAFIFALRHLGAARAGAYFALAPFIGAALSVLVLGEPATPHLLAAGALMGVGLWLHLTERHDHEHAHEVMEHEHLHVHDAHHAHEHDGPITEPHSHGHRHEPLTHSHPHYPDLHHRHSH